MKEILLPRGYISWSQLNLFEKNPKQYYKHYILGEPGFENAAMRYGKKLADALEGNDAGDDETITTLVALLPKYRVMEKKLDAVIGEVKITGKIDNFEPRKKPFKEYKSGMVKWTQSKVDKHEQLLFYATLIYLVYGVIPPKIELVWAETKKDDQGEIYGTGRIEVFERKIDLKDILVFMARIKKVAKGISRMYQEEIKKTF